MYFMMMRDLLAVFNLVNLTQNLFLLELRECVCCPSYEFP